MEELGEGAFGKALKCRRRRDNQIFVVKIMHESKMSAKAIEEVMHCCLKTNPIKYTSAMELIHVHNSLHGDHNCFLQATNEQQCTFAVLI